jgi:hypothetical protein
MTLSSKHSNAPQSKTDKRFLGIPTPLPVAILMVWIFPKQQNYLFVYLFIATTMSFLASDLH